MTTPFIGATGRAIVMVGGTVTRPADTSGYVSGDIVAQDTAQANCSATPFAAARSPGGTGRIKRCRVKAANAAWLTKQVYVHVFKNAPVFTHGDNATFAGGTTEAEYLGAFDVTLDQSFTDPFAKGVGVPKTGAGTDISFDTAAGSSNLYFVVEIRATLTPGSADVLTVVFEIEQD